MEITLSQDQISKYADKILLYSNTCVKELRRLFLVQDLVDSLKVCLQLSLFCISLDKHKRTTQALLYESRLGKVCSSCPAIKVATYCKCSSLMLKCVCVFQFAVLMWLLTYVGALFNGLTLLILGEIMPH